MQSPKGAIALSRQAWWHRGAIALWLLVPLLSGFFNLEQQSLIAHDEGLYATRAREMLLRQDWIHPWDTIHHKTPGSYWILAMSFRLFGVNEVTARFPSILASLAAVLLLYEIAKRLVNLPVALWSAFTLSTMFLWVQYSRFATPDIVFIALFLGSLLCLLQAETSDTAAPWLRFTAGACWSIAFLIRSFLVMVPLAAIAPYLLLDNRRHRHVQSPWLYAGIGVGLVPTGLWLGAVWQRFGTAIAASLTSFPVRKATEDGDHVSGFFFYLTSLELNTLPWGVFAAIGLLLVLRQRFTRQQRLLLGVYPLVIYGLLSLSSTHLHHYPLAVYPMLAILAGVGMETLRRSPAPWAKWTTRLMAGLLGLLGAVLCVAAIVVLVWHWRQPASVAEVVPYVAIALPLGLVWAANTVLWLKSGNRDRWLVGLLLANWITLSAAGSAGIVGNANPDLKAFLRQPEVQPVLAQNAIHYTPLHGKLDVLFRFYTPEFGRILTAAEELPRSGYAWVWEDYLGNITGPYTPISQYKQVHLIRLG